MKQQWLDESSQDNQKACQLCFDMFIYKLLQWIGVLSKFSLCQYWKILLITPIILRYYFTLHFVYYQNCQFVNSGKDSFLMLQTSILEIYDIKSLLTVQEGLQNIHHKMISSSTKIRAPKSDSLNLGWTLDALHYQESVKAGSCYVNCITILASLDILTIQ